jgi:hypothetical protein
LHKPDPSRRGRIINDAVKTNGINQDTAMSAIVSAAEASLSVLSRAFTLLARGQVTVSCLSIVVLSLISSLTLRIRLLTHHLITI